MKTMIFMWYLINGTIVPQKEVEGRQCYRVNFPETTEIVEGNKTFYGTVVDYAYKGEIYKYIETKKFVYNEDLK
jgi:hypothetical protein